MSVAPKCGQRARSVEWCRRFPFPLTDLKSDSKKSQQQASVPRANNQLTGDQRHVSQRQTHLVTSGTYDDAFKAVQKWETILFIFGFYRWYTF